MEGFQATQHTGSRVGKGLTTTSQERGGGGRICKPLIHIIREGRQRVNTTSQERDFRATHTHTHTPRAKGYNHQPRERGEDFQATQTHITRDCRQRVNTTSQERFPSHAHTHTQHGPRVTYNHQPRERGDFQATHTHTHNTGGLTQAPDRAPARQLARSADREGLGGRSVRQSTSRLPGAHRPSCRRTVRGGHVHCTGQA